MGGNVLINSSAESSHSYHLHGHDHAVESCGVKATIIDYTLSRMLHRGCIVYNNLEEDPELFTGKGDYQFDVYRLMRKKLKKKWDAYEPFTNVLWLHYTLDKMERECKYRSKHSKHHLLGLQNIHQWKRKILKHASATEVIYSQEFNLDFIPHQ